MRSFDLSEGLRRRRGSVDMEYREQVKGSKWKRRTEVMSNFGASGYKSVATPTERSCQRERCWCTGRRRDCQKSASQEGGRGGDAKQRWRGLFYLENGRIPLLSCREGNRNRGRRRKLSCLDTKTVEKLPSGCFSVAMTSGSRTSVEKEGATWDGAGEERVPGASASGEPSTQSLWKEGEWAGPGMAELWQPIRGEWH